MLAAELLLGQARTPGTGVTITYAGTDWIFPGDGKPALNAPLGRVTGIAVDPTGNAILVDTDNCIAARIETNGILTVIAGNGICTSSGDGGPPSDAGLLNPFSVAVDAQGNVFILSATQIRKIASGKITSIAKNIASQGGIAVDTAGSVFFADGANHVVRRIRADGSSAIFAGTGQAGNVGDGASAAAAQLSQPVGLAFDTAGNFYIADAGNSNIRKVTPGGVISTLASTLDPPQSVAADAAGSVYFGGRCAIYKVASGSPQIVAGNAAGRCGFAGDGGQASAALLNGPVSLALDNSGNLYVADRNNFGVRKTLLSGVISTIAGNGKFRWGGENVPARTAPLNQPRYVAIANGDLIFSETGNHVVRKVSNGILTTLAGIDDQGFSGDGGPATAARLNSPGALAVDFAGNIYIADTGNNRIRKVTPQGIISTLVSITSPAGLVADPNGNLYVSSRSTVVRVDPAGAITPIAGNGTPGFSGDGGLALNAQLNSPSGLAYFRSILFIADTGNARVRVVPVDTPGQNGTIDTYTPAGPLVSPTGIQFDDGGNLYVADPGAAVISIGGPFIGGGPPGQLGDGKIRTQVTLVNPTSLVFDGRFNMFIADPGTNRVRVVLASTPQLSVDLQNVHLTAPSGGAPVYTSLSVQSCSGIFSLGCLGDPLASFSGFDFKIDGLMSWVTADVTAGTTPQVVTLTVDPSSLPPGDYLSLVNVTSVAGLGTQLPYKLSFTVTAPQPPKLSMDKQSISFTLPKNPTERSETVKIYNTGGGKLSFTASADTDSGGDWLSLDTASGVALPGKPAVLTVSADPSKLSIGTYTGSISVSGSNGESHDVLVTLTISSLSGAFLLSQTGLTFTAVEAGGVVPPQSFGVINVGSATLNWTASTTTLSGNNWLTVAPASGSSPPSGVAPLVQVSVNPQNLTQGVYYGLVEIAAPGAANTPQSVTVVLQVLPRGSDPGALVQPSALIFSASPGNGPPGSQAVFLYGVSAVSKGFRVGAGSGAVSLMAVPREGFLDPFQPMRVLVQPQGDYAAGTYKGALTFEFSDGRVLHLNITLTSSSGGGNPSAILEPRITGSCTPASLAPLLTTLGPRFQVAAGYPVAFNAEVRDNCGNPLRSGNVTVTVNSAGGSDSVALSSLSDGNWQGTWSTPGTPLSQVQLIVSAEDPVLQIKGDSPPLDGASQSALDKPVFNEGGVVSAATAVSFQPIAPGGYIAIYGDRLGDTDPGVLASQLPLPPTLGGVQVKIGGVNAPLNYVGKSQVNVVVPQQLSPNTRHQVFVFHGVRVSLPVYVNVAAAQPALFLQSDGSGIITHADYSLVTPQSPASLGETVIIFCTGLGLTDQNIIDGVPFSGIARTNNSVSVSFGEVSAPAVYSGLVAGLVGLYQVNVVVPAGAPAGSKIPVRLNVAVGSSTIQGPPAPIAIH